MILNPFNLMVQYPNIITPYHQRDRAHGMTFGEGYAGYDVRVRESHKLEPGEFALGSLFEHIQMPNDVVAFVHDKSTWARMGLSLFNTVIEPGWHGYLTIEMANAGNKTLTIPAGCPIAQIIFHQMDAPPRRGGYSGKYQNQGPFPQAAKLE